MLQGKVIAVSGAAGGLGAAIVAAALREGAHVAAGFHRSPLPLERFGDSDRLLPVPLDVRSEESVSDAVSKIHTWGGRIDGFVSAAGVLHTGLLVTESRERADEVLDVNLGGALRCARAVLPILSRQRSGVLLHISSVAAERPTRGQAIYAASKAAIEGLTRALAVEMGGRGVRVLCLRPGAIDTEMLATTKALAPELQQGIPLRRIATAEEIAEVAVFLLSDRASYLTGCVITADGGFTVYGSG